jgi:hypothetical protein
VFQDYFRAVADSGMARARWAVTVGNEWRPGLFAGEEEALKQWRQLGEYVLWFEKQNQDYSSFAIWPSVVVVHDPKRQSTFDSFDILNMLAVRHVPHQIANEGSGVRSGAAAAGRVRRPAIVHQRRRHFDYGPALVGTAVSGRRSGEASGRRGWPYLEPADH